jgi:uncharacterized protein YciI
MPWFVKIEEGTVDKPRFDKYVPAHKTYVEELIAKGHKAKTGYWAQFGGRMMLFEADSMAEAQSIVEDDPLLTYKLYEWRIVVE